MGTKFGIFVSCALLSIGATRAPGDAPRFEIYRVDFVERQGTPAPLPSDSDRRYPHITQEDAAVMAVTRGAPVLTDSDVVEYCWATQRVHLTPEGARRRDSLGGFNMSLGGLPIQIFVDGQPQYAAFAWNPLSSTGCKLPQFWGWTRDNWLHIGSRYVTAEADTILGATYDEEVRQAFREVGTLTEDCRLK